MRRHGRGLTISWYLGMSLFLVVFLLPIIWVYLGSLTPADELASSPWAVFDLRHYSLSAFSREWNSTEFSQAFANSLMVASGVAVCSVALCSVPAYALSRYRFAGRNKLALALLLGQLVPGIIIVIPVVDLLRNLGLTDNLFGLAGVYVVTSIPLGVWLLRGFLDAVPRELDESVLVDGGSLFTVLRHVILPLALPGIITVGAFTFMSSWGEFLFALSLITQSQNWTLPLAIQTAFSENTVDLGALTAGGVFASLPVAILFMLVQRSLVSGLTAGGVKG